MEKRLHRSTRNYWYKRRNSLPEAVQIAKQLILHRIWNNLSQQNLADALNKTYQQYSKFECCDNRPFAEQIKKICDQFGWKVDVIFNHNPHNTLQVWVHKEKINKYPKKYFNILGAWKRLDKNAHHNYYRGYQETKLLGFAKLPNNIAGNRNV